MCRMSQSFPHFAELLQRAQSYGRALWRHAADGLRVSPPEVIAERLAICQACPSGHWDGVGCAVCGCPVNGSENSLRNKLAMASEECPRGHWSRHAGMPQRPKITVGMAMWRDFDGVYFTVRALEMYHPELRGQLEILVVDNCPELEQGPNPEPHLVRETASQRIRNLMAMIPGGRYETYTDRQGTAAPRDAVFRLARGEVVLCIDSHVLIETGALSRTLRWLDVHPEFNGLFQGPLVYDNGQVSTHQNRTWGDGMLGQWALDPRWVGRDGEPFDIPLQGLGLFGCRRDDWLGFNPAFAEFGAEEGYIHDKYRACGRPVVCLPWLGWAHRFQATGAHANYPSSLRQRIKNYVIGRAELDQDLDDVYQHFYGVAPHGLARDPAEWAAIIREVALLEGSATVERVWNGGCVKRGPQCHDCGMMGCSPDGAATPAD